MAAQDCIDAIKAAAGDKLTDDEIAEIAEVIERRRQRAAAGNPMEDPQSQAIAIARELGDDERLAALVEKRNRLKNIEAAERLDTKLDRFVAAGMTENEALRVAMVGDPGAAAGTGRSIDATIQEIEGHLLGGLKAELRPLVPIKMLRMRDFALDVWRELWRLNDGKGEPTGNHRAEEVARVFNRYQEATRLMQNDAGAFIGKLAGYIVRQSHDMFKIARAGYQGWRDFILPRLDERTFDDVEDRDAFLQRIYENFATGKHLDSVNPDWFAGFKGSDNLAKRVSQGRVLHFKSADAAFEYNERFGEGGLLEAAHTGIVRAARATALMRTFGTNPQLGYDRAVDSLIRKARKRGDLTEAGKVGTGLRKAEFKVLTGAAEIPGNPSAALWGSGIRAGLTMAKLGAAMPASFSDLAVRMSVLRKNGIGYLEGYGTILSDTLSRLPAGSERREAAELIGVGLQGFIGGIHSRVSAVDSLPGTMSRWLNTYFKLNLLTWWTDKNAAAQGFVLARHLAMRKDSSFAALNPRLARQLAKYDIGEKEWGLLRHTDMRMVDGTEILAPETAGSLSDDAIRGYLGKPDARPRELARAREDLEGRLRTYYVDQVRTSLTMPGARVRALVTLGQEPGTAVGEAMRFLAMFKSFPITFWMDHVAPALRVFDTDQHEGPQRRGEDRDFVGLAALIAGTTVLGGLSNAVIDVARGRNPRPWGDLDTLKAAFLKGGGLGIYGDFLFGEYNRYGGGPFETLGGPGATLASDVLRIFAAARDGEDFGAKLFRAGLNNAPFVNLFYTRMALDWLVLYHVQEALNPGYLERFERTVARDSGQGFVVPPSSAIARGGGFK